MVCDVYGGHEMFNIGFDIGNWIKRVLASIHNKHWFIAQVVRKYSSLVDFDIGEYHNEAIEREEARIRRSVVHTDVVRSGPAVGYSGNHDAILVDVIGTFYSIDNRA